MATKKYPIRVATIKPVTTATRLNLSLCGRAGDWKLVIVNGKTELHNLKTDLEEKSNVASEQPEIVESLKSTSTKPMSQTQNGCPGRPEPLPRRTLPGNQRHCSAGRNIKWRRRIL